MDGLCICLCSACISLLSAEEYRPVAPSQIPMRRREERPRLASTPGRRECQDHCPPFGHLGLVGVGCCGGGCCYPWLPRPPVLPETQFSPSCCPCASLPERPWSPVWPPELLLWPLLPPSPGACERCPGRWAVMGVIEAQPRPSSGRGAEPAVPSSSVCPRSWMQFLAGKLPGRLYLPTAAPSRGPMES